MSSARSSWGVALFSAAVGAIIGGLVVQEYQRRLEKQSIDRKSGCSGKDDVRNGEQHPSAGPNRSDKSVLIPKNTQNECVGRQTLQDEMKDGTLTVQAIGTVQSIYRLCVGTPRQGLLAPHARGRIVLDRLDVGAASDAVDGLEGFSHIWIVFVFHLNTLQQKKRRMSCKIAPPALGGRKVGLFATRSPHRMNPVGMTLAKLDGIRTIRQKNASGKSMVCLDISGLDLVDGTPVLDIKPYVGTYDAPPLDNDDERVPSWVKGGLATKRSVQISDQARFTIKSLVQQSSLQFYGPNETPEQAYENVVKCIKEVLSMDVRSVYQTQKVRQGKSQAERTRRLQNVRSREKDNSDSSTTCTQQIDNLLVHFQVKQAENAQRSTSGGSGAEDLVFVTRIELIQGEST